jgi:hypothetical protein
MNNINIRNIAFGKGWLWKVSVKAKQLEHIILKTDFPTKRPMERITNKTQAMEGKNYYRRNEQFSFLCNVQGQFGNFEGRAITLLCFC